MAAAAVHVVARIRGRGGWVTGAAAGGHSPEIDEHDKSSGGDTGLNDSTRQPTDLRIQCIEFLSSSPAEQGWSKGREHLVNTFPSYLPPASVFLQNYHRFRKFHESFPPRRTLVSCMSRWIIGKI